MDRPRITSIVSGAAASVAAFLVVSQWNLLGTVLGAALVPVVGTLVSHLSLSVIEKLNERARARLPWASRAERRRDEERTLSEVSPQERDAHDAAQPQPPRDAETVSWWRRAMRVPVAQWTLVSVSCAALGVSVFAVAAPEPEGETVIRERVIERTVERTVTVTTETTGEVAVEPGAPGSGTVTSVTPTPVTSTDTTDRPRPGDDQVEEAPTSGTVTTGSSADSSSIGSVDTAQPADGSSGAGSSSSHDTVEAP